jgi:hypothetical protein
LQRRLAGFHRNRCSEARIGLGFGLGEGEREGELEQGLRMGAPGVGEGHTAVARGIIAPVSNYHGERGRKREKQGGLPCSPQGGALAAVGGEIGAARRRV